ncbi:NADP-dependent oxidoreductase [Thermomonospora cellulosilytica]|uniref:NADPH:quinone reductase-like Zn-dependent oxidoreductase n=1 Tax=Thermomonospora cellulosilytica TaxID=1411118 RepID=A0A7W3R6F3_9ACTN|nr:NADP-dependent oxidoreductase [Thermomonospora cellulosilytica]MBA9002098.1 NADPH:quinone reductase-like Zn-dependent oxidoreductase [Thermomonospora cellulosilytica]
MRAISQRSWGAPEVLTEVEVERPRPGPAEILVRVHAAGINPVDWKSRATGGFGLWGEPPILGWDVSGVVEETGPGVTIFQPGDEVFGMPRFPHQAGAYAEYVTAPARHFARKPAGLDHVQAAALPLAGLTAWQALVDTADVRPGRRVLIHAAAGGVGHLAVQIAKARGAHVIGTARGSKHELLRDLGADELIDYTETDFTEAVANLDVVIDPIGGDYGPRSLKVLRPDGVLVSLNSPDEDALRPRAAALGRRAGFMLVEPDRTGLSAIADLVSAGRLRPVIDAVFPLSEAAKAHHHGETGRTTGKLVLTVHD